MKFLRATRRLRSIRIRSAIGSSGWFADIRTGFLHELKCCRQIPAVAVHPRRAAKLIVVDPHQLKRYTLVTKEVDLGKRNCHMYFIQTVLYRERSTCRRQIVMKTCLQICKIGSEKWKKRFSTCSSF